MDTRKELYLAFKLYISDKYQVRDDCDKERLFAGVMAFIATQVYEEPFEPLTVGFFKEDKKWWQFWK
jgi:hypothetical protein